MGESDRKILIDIEANYDQVKRAAVEIEKLEKEKVTVQCAVDVDGKKLKSNIQGVLNEIGKDGLKQKVTLELNTSALSKELKKAEALSKKSAQQIASDFEKATTSRATSTLRSNLTGKKSFSKDSDTALKELIAYRNAALKQVKDIEFDFSDPTKGMDEDRIHRYGKALRELSTVMQDVNQVSSAKGLTLPALDDASIDKTARKLEDLQKASTSLVNSFGKNQMTNITSVIKNVTKEFMDLPNAFGKTSFDGVVADAQAAGQAVSKATQEVKELQQAADKPVDIDIKGTEAQELNSVAIMLDTIIKKVNEKTAAFRSEAAAVNGVVDNEIAALGKVLSMLDKITTSAEQVSTAIKGTQLEQIAKIDFSKLNNLKSSDKSFNILAKQSKQFLDTQNKQIDADLKRYRTAGMSEDDLKPIKEAKELLNSTFNTSGLFDMSDVNGEMAAFVSMLSDAENKCDNIAASMKAIKNAEEASNQEKKKASDINSEYDKLLNQEKNLLNKQLKKGSLGHEDRLTLDQVREQRRAIQKDSLFNNEEGVKRRKAIFADLRDDYTSFMTDVETRSKKLVEDTEHFLKPDQVTEAKKIYEGIQVTKDNFQKSGGLFTDENIKQTHEFSKTLKELEKTYNTNSKAKGSYIGSFGDATNINEALTKTKELIKTQAEARKSKVNFIDHKEDGTKGSIIYDEITNDGTIKRQVASFNMLDGAIRNATNSEKEYVSQGQKFINSVKGKFMELTRYITVMDILRNTLNFVRNGVSAIVDINTAMTELKKVTDETTETYANFQQAAGKTAVTVGSTTKDIISSTADYARLGYSIDESAELAKNTAIYKNVGDGIDITTATEDIVSITKAYGIAAEESMHVIDVLNEVGKRLPRCFSNIASKLITISVKVMGMMRPRKDIMFIQYIINP